MYFFASTVPIPTWTFVFVFIPLIIMVIVFTVVDRMRKWGYWKSQETIREETNRDTAQDNVIVIKNDLEKFIDFFKEFQDDVEERLKKLQDDSDRKFEKISDVIAVLHDQVKDVVKDTDDMGSHYKEIRQSINEQTNVLKEPLQKVSESVEQMKFSSDRKMEAYYIDVVRIRDIVEEMHKQVFSKSVERAQDQAFHNISEMLTLVKELSKMHETDRRETPAWYCHCTLSKQLPKWDELVLGLESVKSSLLSRCDTLQQVLEKVVSEYKDFSESLKDSNSIRSDWYNTYVDQMDRIIRLMDLLIERFGE